jgi:hypothetical protein
MFLNNDREKSSQTKCIPFCLRDEKNRQVCLISRRRIYG